VCEYIKQAEMKGLPRIATIQNLYNLTARAFETSCWTRLLPQQVSLLAYSPLAFGQLSAKYLDNPQAHGRLTIFPPNWSPRYLRPEVLAAVKEYAALARANGMSPAQMALAWCYSRWFVARPSSGRPRLAQLKETSMRDVRCRRGGGGDRRDPRPHHQSGAVTINGMYPG
jgi:aryl-alcohol dehydrogenase-like predicted oxidoreductase